MVGSEMSEIKEEFAQLFREAWKNHRGCVFGVILGALIAVSILLFGFWNMLFIGFCAAVGLWLGKQVDDADDDWPQRLREVGVQGLLDLVRRR